MSDDRATSGVNPMVQPFVDFWSSYIQQANESTRQWLEGLDDSADVKSWQRRWSEAVNKSMDAYLRSPAFLHAMRENTDRMIQVKRQTDDLAAEIARNANIPTASDISGLFERLHTIEEVILERLVQIEERLKAIESQTGVGEGAGI